MPRAMKDNFEHAQGHWILARMGKRVLRPGGKELTLKMMSGLGIRPSDHVVEFAPGTGYTAQLTLARHPASYTGVELNEKAADRLNRTLINGQAGAARRIIVANAAASTLEDRCADKVYGEAMLTMHIDKQKTTIIREAYRLLKPGGLYGIHELCLTPDDMDEEEKSRIQRELAVTIKVNARPQTTSEWIRLMTDEGFVVRELHHNPMHLLEKRRMVDDEGVFGAMRIGFNVLTHAAARKRILAMRRLFHKYQDNLSAISIIAAKA